MWGLIGKIENNTGRNINYITKSRIFINQFDIIFYTNIIGVVNSISIPLHVHTYFTYPTNSLKQPRYCINTY